MGGYAGRSCADGDGDGDDSDDEDLVGVVGYAGQQPGVLEVLRSSRQLITMMEALPADWEAGAAKLKRLFRRRWYKLQYRSTTIEGRDRIWGRHMVLNTRPHPQPGHPA